MMTRRSSSRRSSGSSRSRSMTRGNKEGAGRARMVDQWMRRTVIVMRRREQNGKENEKKW
jgi:hypothetical protein